MPATKAAMPKPASFVLRTLIPAAAAARSFERTASIRWPRLDRRTLATSRASRIVAARTRKPKTGLGMLAVQAPEATASGRQVERRRASAARPATPRPPPQRVVQEPELLERDGRRERDDGEADAADAQRGDRDQQPDDRGGGGADQERDRELRPDPAGVRREVRHREARDAGERELHDGDLADEADDHDEREADQDAEQRVDQRLAEVVREHDQRDDAGDRRDHARPSSRSGRGTAGSRFSTSSPRPGRLAPRRKIARTMTRKTKSSGRPRIGAPRRPSGTSSASTSR